MVTHNMKNWDMTDLNRYILKANKAHTLRILTI